MFQHYQQWHSAAEPCCGVRLRQLPEAKPSMWEMEALSVPGL